MTSARSSIDVSRISGNGADLPWTLALTAIVVAAGGWLALAAAETSITDGIGTLSPHLAASLRRAALGGETIVLGSLVSAGLAGAALGRWPAWTVAAGASGFAVSETVVPAVNFGSAVVRFSVIVALIALAVSRIGRIVSQVTSVQVLAFALFAWAAVSTYLDTAHSGLSFLPMQAAVLLGLVGALPGSLLYGSERARAATALAYVGAGLIMFHASALVFSNESWIEGRFRAWFLLPTNFAHSVSLPYLAVVWLALFGERRVVRLLMAGVVLVGAVLLVLTGTRGALVAVGAGASVMLLMSPWRTLGVVVVGLTAVAIAQVSGVLQLVPQEVSSRLMDPSSQTRVAIWAKTWDLIWAKPVLGYGLGTPVSAWITEVDAFGVVNPHNAYLGTWLRLGVIGLTLVVLVYAGAIGRGVMEWRRAKERGDPVVLFLGLVVALLVGGLVEDNLHSRGSIQQFVLGLSIAAIYASRLRRAARPGTEGA